MSRLGPAGVVGDGDPGTGPRRLDADRYFVAVLIGQALAGLAEFHNQLLSQGLEQIGFWRYITSSDFAVDVAENWPSEYLQFFLYITATVYLVQRGSPESKPVDRQGREPTGSRRLPSIRRPIHPGGQK
jgi:hypothetical protein